MTPAWNVLFVLALLCTSVLIILEYAPIFLEIYPPHSTPNKAMAAEELWPTCNNYDMENMSTLLLPSCWFNFSDKCKQLQIEVSYPPRPPNPTRYPGHRTLVVEDIFGLMLKMPTGRRQLRTFRLGHVPEALGGANGTCMNISVCVYIYIYIYSNVSSQAIAMPLAANCSVWRNDLKKIG